MKQNKQFKLFGYLDNALVGLGRVVKGAVKGIKDEFPKQEQVVKSKKANRKEAK